MWPPGGAGEWKDTPGVSLIPSARLNWRVVCFIDPLTRRPLKPVKEKGIQYLFPHSWSSFLRMRCFPALSRSVYPAQEPSVLKSSCQNKLKSTLVMRGVSWEESSDARAAAWAVCVCVRWAPGQWTQRGAFQHQHVTRWRFITDGRTSGPTGDVDWC